MNIIRKTLLPLFPVLLISMLLTGCSPSASTQTPAALPVTAVPERTLSEARIVPIRNAALSFPSAGIVDEVIAPEGASVKEGDVIARLKGTDRARAAITQAEVQILSAKKDLDDFIEKSDIARANAELILAKARIELKNARDARDSLDYQQVSGPALDSLRATYYMALKDFKDAEDEYEPYKDRGEKDLERAQYLQKLSNARLAKDKALYNLNKALEMPDPEKISRADARLSLAEAALIDAEATYDKVKSGPDESEKIILDAALKNAEAQLKAARAALEDLELRAPFDGTVISNDLKPGQAVSPIVTVMLGDISAWQVETTDLVEQDIINIQPGDPVTVAIDAIPSLKLPGVVNRIKQMGIASKGDTTYTVFIDLEESDPRLLWNMKAFVAFEK
ncbi:MAG: HlyD family efflux transporter periplasmic adaptor subunit [Chloroflexi bacterium]|nr:HlyD family efflux transporter periplasmic adaptor subunit [Chloroflexota bacterium]